MSAWTGALKPSAARVLRHVVDHAVGDEDRAGERSGGTSATSCVSAAKSSVPSPRVAVAGARPRGRRSRQAPRAAPSARRRLRRSARARSPSFWLALLVDDERDDAGQRLALLALQHRVGERGQQEGASASAPERDAANALRDDERATSDRRRAPRRCAASSGQRQERRRRTMLEAASLAEPLEQRRHVHLVGLVVAGQRVHHDVDAGAEGHLALALVAGHGRVERLAALVDRPGAGEIVAVIRIGETPSPPRAGRPVALRRIATGSRPRVRVRRSGRGSRRAGRRPWSARGRAAPARAAACRRPARICAQPLGSGVVAPSPGIAAELASRVSKRIVPPCFM